VVDPAQHGVDSRRGEGQRPVASLCSRWQVMDDFGVSWLPIRLDPG
jgi:hypothetical protein